ncbi:MAG: N-acetylmuramidase domain-containing protein, partial [Caulobacter sp.]
TGRRLAQGDVGDAARALGVETPVLLAFMEVEAAGRGFDSRNRPKMLFEPHIFWRELGAGARRDRAASQGLAYARWGAARYPSDSYPRLTSAIAIDQNSALRSASYGLGQIMGFNASTAGHATALQLVQAAMQGEREQLMQMVTLMRAWGMVSMLTGKDFSKPDSWRPAAQKWNGSGYATHNYHGRMATAFIKHSRGEQMQIPPVTVSVLRERMKGEAVHNLQADLVELGFDPGPVDGRFGPKTKLAVKAFQASANIGVDGVAGPATFAAIERALAALEPQAPPTMSPDASVSGGPADITRTGIIAAIFTLVALAAAFFIGAR